MISLIVACSANNVIGKDNQMPWHLPRDLAYFKNKTSNNIVLMGRKTFQSIGKALPNRNNIVLSREKFHAENISNFQDLESALNWSKSQEKEIFIIGGGEIYRQSLPLAERVFLSKIYAQFAGDTFFPDLHKNEWQLVSDFYFPADEKNPYPISFQEYLRL